MAMEQNQPNPPQAPTVPLSGNPPATFAEYHQLIAFRLDDMAKQIDRLDGKVDNLQTGMARLEVKSGAWGAIGGFLSSLAVCLVALALSIVGQKAK